MIDSDGENNKQQIPNSNNHNAPYKEFKTMWDLIYLVVIVVPIMLFA